MEKENNKENSNLNSKENSNLNRKENSNLNRKENSNLTSNLNSKEITSSTSLTNEPSTPTDPNSSTSNSPEDNHTKFPPGFQPGFAPTSTPTSIPTSTSTPAPIITLLQPGRDISIKPEESKDQFGDELFEQLIINFVEKDYEDKKMQIEEALANKNAANLYYIVHTFKTTARMLCIEDFAKECEIIQEYSFKGREDWDKLSFLVPQFLQDFQAVYEDAKTIYDRDYKPKPAEIMDDPYMTEERSVNANSNDSKSNEKIDSQNSFRFFVENKSQRRGSITQGKNQNESMQNESCDEAEDKVDSSGVLNPSKRKMSNHRDSEMVDKVYELTESKNSEIYFENLILRIFLRNFCNFKKKF
jgi:hypothetical protein